MLKVNIEGQTEDVGAFFNELQKRYDLTNEVKTDGGGYVFVSCDVKGDKALEVTTINLLLQNGEKFPIPIVRCIYADIGDGKHIVSGWSHDIFAVPGASR